MSGRVWFARDTGFITDPRVQHLGHEYGPGGPLVLEEVYALAMLAEDGGVVSATYAILAGRAFVKAPRAKVIVRTAADIGLLDEFSEIDGKSFEASIPSWRKWNPKDRTAAKRAQTYRLRHGKTP